MVTVATVVYTLCAEVCNYMTVPGETFVRK